MAKGKKIALALAAALCLLLLGVGLYAALWEPGGAADSTPLPASASAAAKTPEEQLLGLWVQTQDYLDYENENIHSPGAGVTEKSSLEFFEDGTCAYEHPHLGPALFSWEHRDGAVILMAEGWAPWQMPFDGENLIDQKTGIPRFEKVS